MRRIFGELHKTEKTITVAKVHETRIARLLETMLRLGMFFSVLFSYAYYLFVQATKLSLNVSSGKFLPINTKVDLRSVSFQSRPREISKLI